MESIFGKSFENELKKIMFSIMDEYFKSKEESIVEIGDKKGIIMTADEVAEYTQFSLSYINRLLNTPLTEGGIPCVRIGNRRRVWKHELEEWMETKREEPYEIS